MSDVPVIRKLAPLVPRDVRKAVSRFLPSRHVVRGNYYRGVGAWPDLEAPKTISEKLLWLQVNYITPLMIDCSDKRIVRQYVEACGGQKHLIPLLHDDLSVEDVRPEIITEQQFVLKATHDSGTVMVCEDRDTFDWAGAREFLQERLQNNYFWVAREPNYRPLKAKIIVEAHAKYVGPESSHPLVDYKFYCINGSPKAVVVMTPKRHAQTGEICAHNRFYDLETWESLPWRRGLNPDDPDVSPKPACLEDMVKLIKCLAAPFPFVRIDFMSADGGASFTTGELTFYPSGGTAVFQPSALERSLGEQLQLPSPVDISAVQSAWYPGQGIEELKRSKAKCNRSFGTS